MAGTKGEIDYAIRRAFNKFDQWNDVTGYVPKFSGYYYEIQAVIEDAVHCGFQRALDQEGPLPSEQDDELQASAEPTERTLGPSPNQGSAGMTIQPGKLLFEFGDFEDWCNLAQRWFREAEHDSTSAICLDSLGRTCWRGADFMQARDEQTFPVKVFSLRR